MAATSISSDDLGLIDQRFGEVKLVGRPAQEAEAVLPVHPDQVHAECASLPRSIVFNGQLYQVGVPVNSELDWKAYRFGYEYDSSIADRGFVGLILEAKYTDVTATLATPIVNEFAHAQAPIPAIGGIGRIYIVPNDLDHRRADRRSRSRQRVRGVQRPLRRLRLYGTVNFTRNVGAQVGYRSFDVGYLVRRDTGAFTVKGMLLRGRGPLLTQPGRLKDTEVTENTGQLPCPRSIRASGFSRT